MKKQLLEDKYEAIISTYWFWADQLLMLRNMEEGQNWLVNNFIEITYEKTGLPYQIYFYNDRVRNKTVELYNCPFWRMQKIDFDDNHYVMGKNILDYSRDCINKNMYLLLMVNRKYIDSYGYQNDNLHQILVHGYDDEQEIIYYADNRRDGKYDSMLTCKYSELLNGFKNADYFLEEPDFGTSIFTFYIEKTKEYPVNMKRVVRMINAYYQSVSETDNGRPSGINVYLDLIKYYKKGISLDIEIATDIRGVHTLWDHKKAMIARLEYLKDIVEVSEEWIETYKKIEKKSGEIVRLLLKYSVVKRERIIYNIIDLLEVIYTLESSVLKEILQNWSVYK